MNTNRTRDTCSTSPVAGLAPSRLLAATCLFASAFSCGGPNDAIEEQISNEYSYADSDNNRGTDNSGPDWSQDLDSVNRYDQRNNSQLRNDGHRITEFTKQ